MDNQRDNTLLRSIAMISKILALLMVVFFSIVFIGELLNHTQPFGIEEYLLLFFIPDLFAVGAIIAFKKEVIGSIVMISSLIIFNILSYIFEQTISDFDFAIFLIPSVLLLFVNYRKNKKDIKK